MVTHDQIRTSEQFYHALFLDDEIFDLNQSGEAVRWLVQQLAGGAITALKVVHEDETVRRLSCNVLPGFSVKAVAVNNLASFLQKPTDGNTCWSFSWNSLSFARVPGDGLGFSVEKIAAVALQIGVDKPDGNRFRDLPSMPIPVRILLARLWPMNLLDQLVASSHNGLRLWNLLCFDNLFRGGGWELREDSLKRCEGFQGSNVYLYDSLKNLVKQRSTTPESLRFQLDRNQQILVLFSQVAEQLEDLPGIMADYLVQKGGGTANAVRQIQLAPGRAGTEVYSSDLNDLKEEIAKRGRRLAQIRHQVKDWSLFASLEEKILPLALVDEPILILGPTGSGKTTLAQHIHSLSARAAGPFIEINCAAIPPEGSNFHVALFGRERESATDAPSAVLGVIQRATHGTLFLDEIDHLPLDQQAKLLRVIDDGLYSPFGSTEMWRADVRIISASNRPDFVEWARGQAKKQDKQNTQFLSDLFERLYFAWIDLPGFENKNEWSDDRLDEATKSLLENTFEEWGPPKGSSQASAREKKRGTGEGPVDEALTHINKARAEINKAEAITDESLRHDLLKLLTKAEEGMRKVPKAEKSQSANPSLKRKFQDYLHDWNQGTGEDGAITSDEPVGLFSVFPGILRSWHTAEFTSDGLATLRENARHVGAKEGNLRWLKRIVRRCVLESRGDSISATTVRRVLDPEASHLQQPADTEEIDTRLTELRERFVELSERSSQHPADHEELDKELDLNLVQALTDFLSHPQFSTYKERNPKVWLDRPYVTLESNIGVSQTFPLLSRWQYLFVLAAIRACGGQDGGKFEWQSVETLFGERKFKDKFKVAIPKIFDQFGISVQYSSNKAANSMCDIAWFLTDSHHETASKFVLQPDKKGDKFLDHLRFLAGKLNMRVG